MHEDRRTVTVLAALAVGLLAGIGGGALWDDVYTAPAEREHALRVEIERDAAVRIRELEDALARSESAQRLANREWTDAVAALVEMRKERDALKSENERLRSR